MALCWAERALSGDWWKQRPDYTVRKSIGGEAVEWGLLRKLAAQVSCGQDLGRREREGVMSGAKEEAWDSRGRMCPPQLQRGPGEEHRGRSGRSPQPRAVHSQDQTWPRSQLGAAWCHQGALTRESKGLGSGSHPAHLVAVCL